MRFTAALVTAALLTAGLPATAALAQSGPRDISDTCAAGGDDFPDTGNNVHAARIRCIRDAEITVGKSDGTYDPAGNLTRGQLATFTVRTLDAAGIDIPAPGSIDDWYSDDDGSPHEHNANVLAAFDVFRTGRSTFEPAEPVTRALMAEVVGRALRVTGVTPPQAVDAFSDDDGDVFEQSINEIFGHGIVSGRTDGTYGASALVRRDQMATFLARLLDALANENASTPATGAVRPGTPLPWNRAVPVGLWDLMITAFNDDADDMLADAGNEPASNGRYGTVSIRATYRGTPGVATADDLRHPWIYFTMGVPAASSGSPWIDLGCSSTATFSGSLIQAPEARPGETVTGTNCIDAPISALSGDRVFGRITASGGQETFWTTSIG